MFQWPLSRDRRQPRRSQWKKMAFVLEYLGSIPKGLPCELFPEFITAKESRLWAFTTFRSWSFINRIPSFLKMKHFLAVLLRTFWYIAKNSQLIFGIKVKKQYYQIISFFFGFCESTTSSNQFKINLVPILFGTKSEGFKKTK